MRGVRSLLGVVAVVAVGAAVPGNAASQNTLSAKHRTVHWSGTLTGSAPLGCNNANLGCDRYSFVVAAPRGAWVTVSVDAPDANLRVTTSSGELVGNGGAQSDPNPDNTSEPTTTFQQVSTGRVTYDVLVGQVIGTPANPTSYRGTAELAGHAFDRAGDCGATSGLEHVRDEDNGRPTPPLRVRLVADPHDATAVRVAGKTVAEIYARINVPVKVSYDFFHLADEGTVLPYEQVRRHYGGTRPPGVDVVDVITDLYAGGVADCIGGIAYPEKAFAVSNLHYTVQGTLPVDEVPAGMVAAHEIGHLLGAQHQQVSCAEALPQELASPASDGWIGPCTLMGPAALQDSETFSTLEKATIRAFARSYAGR